LRRAPSRVAQHPRFRQAPPAPRPQHRRTSPWPI
jgi:hypothetical protein